MLPGQAVPDAIRRGLGLAARAVGDWCDLYRPSGTGAALTPANRILRLPAAFAHRRGFAVAAEHGEALWQGVFDAAYTLPGDYLRGADGTFFIAAQPRLGPVLCVKTNRTLTLARPAGPALAGMNRYVGVLDATLQPLLTAWPASVLGAGAGGRGMLPGDAPGLLGGWAVLLPTTPVVLKPGDVAHDDLGRAAVIAGAELTALGWRLHMKQAAS